MPGRSASPDRLADRLEGRLPRPIRALVKPARRDDIPLLSAGLAFYAIVSLIPLTILAMWFASLVLGDDRIQQLARALGRVAPTSLGADQALRRVAELGSRLGLVAAITALWPATSYGSGLERAFHRIGGGNPERMPGVKGRSLFFLFLLPVFVLGTLVGSYAGAAALGESAVGRILGVGLAMAAGFLAAAASLIAIYRIFPPKPLPWASTIRATLAVGAGISVLSALLVVFLSLGADFEEHYATSGLAGLLLLALWLFLSNALLLVGYKLALEM